MLGVQWIKSLGPILTDYTDLTMKFKHHNKIIELHSERDYTICGINHYQLKGMVQIDGVNAFFHIDRMNPELPSNQQTQPLTQDPTIISLLHRYHSLFQPPTTLPPPHDSTHTINLLPNSFPVNVRPYRYPHFQKHEIDT